MNLVLADICVLGMVPQRRPNLPHHSGNNLHHARYYSRDDLADELNLGTLKGGGGEGAISGCLYVIKIFGFISKIKKDCYI